MTDIGNYHIVRILFAGTKSSSAITTNKVKKTTDYLRQYELSLDNPSMIADFEDVLVKLEKIKLEPHKMIAQIHDVWMKDLKFFVTGEYINGVMFNQYLIKNKLSESKSIQIIIQLGDALTHLHNHEIIHGDFQPGSIIITPNEDPRLIFPGLTYLEKKYGFNDQSFDEFASPEVKNNQKPTVKSDIYSLGILAYELLTNSSSQGGIFISLLPKKYQKAVLDALREIPEERYESIIEFTRTLKNCHAKTSEKDETTTQSDKLNQLLSHQKKFYMLSQTPKWPNISIQIRTCLGMDLAGIYYDFYEEKEQKGYHLFLAESITGGLKGLLNIINFRGFIMALLNQSVENVALTKELNRISSQDSLGETYSFTHILLNPNKNQIEVISCGNHGIWMYNTENKQTTHIKPQDKALGLDTNTPIKETRAIWRSGDYVLVTSSSIKDRMEGVKFDEFVETSQEKNMKDIPDEILKRVSDNRKPFERTAVLMMISHED